MGNTDTTDDELVNHFRAMLERAMVARQVDGLESRNAIYASAREALDRHLKGQSGASDFAVADEIARHLDSLELAISQIEDELNKSEKNPKGRLAQGNSESVDPTAEAAAVEGVRGSVTDAPDQDTPPTSTNSMVKPSRQSEATGQANQNAGPDSQASDNADDGASGDPGNDQSQRPEPQPEDPQKPDTHSGDASEKPAGKSGNPRPGRDEGVKHKTQPKNEDREPAKNKHQDREAEQAASKSVEKKPQKKSDNNVAGLEPNASKNSDLTLEEKKKNTEDIKKPREKSAGDSKSNEKAEEKSTNKPETEKRSAEKPGSDDGAASTNQTEEEASLFEGAPEIADDIPAVPPPGVASTRYRLSKGAFLMLGAALVAMIFAIFVFGDPRYWWVDRRLAQTDVLSDIITETGVQEFLDTEEFEDMPAPIVRMAELSQRREITGSLSQQGEGDDRQTVVQFDELSLSLVFDVRRDTAPQRETRDIIHVEIGQTPEPIFSFGSPMLVFPNVRGISGIDSVPVRLGMRRLAIGLMEPIRPILDEEDVAFAVFTFPVRFESGERIGSV